MPSRVVVLGERRIGDDPVEPHQLAALDVCSGSARVSSLRRSASGMPCRSMFILQMDQTPPLFSWP